MFAVAGAEALVARLATTTFNVLSCCPTPVFPSEVDLVHCAPHAATPFFCVH